MPATDIAPAEETYNEVKRLLYSLCWSYQKRYGGEIEELLSLANEGFVRAWQSWQPGKGSKFSTYVYNHVRWLLTSYHRESNRPKHKPPTTAVLSMSILTTPDGEEQWEPEARRVSNLQAVLGEVGRDAATIIRLALALPDYEREPSSLRRSLVQTLLKLGWSGKRIKQGWREIRDSNVVYDAHSAELSNSKGQVP